VVELDLRSSASTPSGLQIFKSPVADADERKVELTT